MGVPGRSYALEIAQKWGMPELFISTARSKLSEDHERVEKLIEQLQERVKSYEDLQREAARLRDELREKNNQLDKALSQLDAKRTKNTG